ncbi:chaplin family protein [Streptomyces sp. TRM70350]|uniref:chaplin family protein n=1 Tax=Streptomyces sp. TRM70350 TaxID=2856165 RepID=UPI001C4503D2|nr:chaplin family protein [Streptomyces sp. TRM70350]MBV7698550.1 chaplin [Streptomyces sp. TRM70350]
MKRVTRNGVIAVAAASGAMAVTFPAHADSAADGAAVGSPGLISGNTVQVPVHVPVNVCGNTVNVVGLLNPAAGNRCANVSAADDQDPGSGGSSGGGAVAESSGKDSPGVISGNGVQVPVHLPVNVSGNTVNVVGVGNGAVGNESVNGPGDRPVRPERPASPPEPSIPPKALPAPKPTAPHTAPPTTSGLADTGADVTLPAAIGGTAMVLGGAALYRRFRPRAVR